MASGDILSDFGINLLEEEIDDVIFQTNEFLTDATFTGSQGPFWWILQMCMALAALFAIVMAAGMAYKMMVKNEPLDIMKLFKPLAISIILCWWYPPADTGMVNSGSNWCVLDFLSYIPNCIGSYTHDLYQAEATQLFFKTVQNKMHFSAHGHTAAEVIYERADAEKDFMGLTSWTGAMPKRTDAEVAKNYLSADELDTLNRIVSLYLDFAELQAKSHQPMYMKDWIQKLDDFLKLSGKELLTHAGRISAEIAKQKADMEYDKFKERTMYELSPVEIHFLENFEKEQKKLKE